jgi:hypothetical protein
VTDVWRRVAVVAAPLLLLAGCSDDATPLDSDALPSDVASSDSGSRGFPSVTNCSQLGTRQSSISADARSAGGFEYWTYHLDSGDHVTASVLAFDDEAAVEAALDELGAAIAECADETSGTTEVTAIDGLPDGVTGYRSSQRFDDTTQEGAMVFAGADDNRIVTVSASRTDGTQPTVDLVELLEQAQERAPDLDDLPTSEDG